MLDELVPKATGREAKIEKKKARAEKKRSRGYSPGDPVCNMYAVTVLY